MRSIKWVAPLRDGIPTHANGSRCRPSVTSLRSSILLALLVVPLVACQGFVGDRPPGPDDPGGGGGGGGGGSGDGGVDLPEGVVVAAPQSRIPRLTHDEWERTVQELLHLDGASGLESALRTDSLPGEAVFDNPGGMLSVDEVLWAGYQRAATTLAERVTADPALLARVAPGTMDEAGAEAFIRAFGLRAHRRPLEDAEVAEYMALYRAAAGLYGTLGAFPSGIRLVLEAMLQSPFFLYRVELSATPAEDAIPLDDYEVASRLSYALWGSMPDEELFAAAAAGMLSERGGVEVQARRMLEDARAEERVVDFHRQLFDVNDFAGIAPSPTAFPGVSARLGEYAAAEHDLFVRELVFGQDATYGDLLTSTATFVNADLARIYGIPGAFGDELVPVMLNDAERRGVLTQIGFLASNSTRTSPDPIHRGVFIAERIACIPIAAPPANTPPPDPVPGLTNRETIAAHTEQPGSICAGCHAQIINPFGFAFESYDAIGAWRTEDSGFPVDTMSSPPVDGMPTPVSDATELAGALADSEWAHECYSRHWIEFALGRHIAPEDEALIAQLSQPSQRGELAVRELIVSLVTSPAFLTRSAREVSE